MKSNGFVFKIIFGIVTALSVITLTSAMQAQENTIIQTLGKDMLGSIEQHPLVIAIISGIVGSGIVGSIILFALSEFAKKLRRRSKRKPVTPISVKITGNWDSIKSFFFKYNIKTIPDLNNNDCCILTEYKGKKRGNVSLPSTNKKKKITIIKEGAFKGCPFEKERECSQFVWEADINPHDDNNLMITGYYGKPEKISIPAELAGKKITAIDDKAFLRCASLTGVTISEGITVIRKHAFRDCKNLMSSHSGNILTIPASVTDIGTGAFANCSSIKSFRVMAGSRSYKDEDGVLFDASGETLVAYPPGREKDTYHIPDGVTKVGKEAFRACDKLFIIEMPDSITRIKPNAFMFCKNLKSVKLSSKLNKIERYVFWGCENLDDVKIPDSVQEIGMWAFPECTKLPSDFNIPSGVNKIDGGAFYGCTKFERTHPQ